MVDIAFACACGAVRGGLQAILPRHGIRYVCHCDDCQAFAHFLGKAEAVLDGHGGTDVFQTPATRFFISEGRDQLACVKVTQKPLLRWYARCCRTPIANTYASGKFSFLAVILLGFEPTRRNQAFGKVSGHCYTQFATGKLKGVAQVNIPAMILRLGWRVISARITGDYRRNPLFDPKSGRPVVEPYQLTKAERAALGRPSR